MQSGIRSVSIVPRHIHYECKDGIRSRVLMQVGQPIALDTMMTRHAPVDVLNADIHAQLHAVTLHFDDKTEADEILKFATVVAAVTDVI